MNLINKINKTCLEIYKVYNTVIRTPSNWHEERKRLLANPNTRAKWVYQIPNLDKYSDIIMDLEKRYKEYKKKIQTDKNRKTLENIYAKFEPRVIEASLHTAKIKLKILNDLQHNQFHSTHALRKEFYKLNYRYEELPAHYEKVLLHKKRTQELGRAFSDDTQSVQSTAAEIKTYLTLIRERMGDIINYPSKRLARSVHKAFVAEVKIIDDPSFIMRCTTDPVTKITHVLLNSARRYSPVLTKIGACHEFGGHALEMALFDNTLIAQKKISSIYGYAGVSSPNIFDVKAEVFADKIIYPFMEPEEQEYMYYRRNVWLLCRAMADNLYHFQQGSIHDVMKIFEQVGLEKFAFDEAIMASIFIDGYQGMYFFANQEIEKSQEELHLNENDFLTRLLFLGKIPISEFGKFMLPNTP